MIMNYVYTPYIWPSTCVAILFFALFLYSWQRRDIPGAAPFAIASLLATVWLGASALQLAAADIPTQTFWYKVQAILQLPTITSITAFLLEFVWPGRFLTRRNVILLSLPCALLWIGAFTNPIFHLAWRGFTYDGTVVPIRGPLNVILIAYGLALGFVNIIVLTWLFLRSPQNRWLALIMFLSLGVTRAIYLLVIVGRINTVLPINALINVIPFIVYSIALFRFRILDPIPLAHHMAIEQLKAGILILDSQGKIISLNPAGAAILGGSIKQLIGQQLQDLMPECTSLIMTNSPTSINRMEVRLGTSSAPRYYQIECSTLNDWRGLLVGLLLLMHDVTKQKDAQAQLIEQQRALASLKEREQIARELHDELSQELAMINVQAQLVAGLLETGKDEKAREQLHILAKAARNTQVDVRGQISKLLLSTDSSEDFLAALRRFMDWFRQVNHIKTELVLADPYPRIVLSPMEEVQLLRIIQEAFTNIRKHSQAKKVLLTVKKDTMRIKVTIEDDGIGFDPGKLPTPGNSFGLGIISARAKDIGGSVAVHSIPGQGTQIEVVIPCS